MRDAPSDDLSPLESWVVSQRAAMTELSDDAEEQVENLEIYGLIMGFVEALTHAIAHDRRVAVVEAELLRTICAALHCPLPPLPLVEERA